MLVIAGFQNLGVFSFCAKKLCSKIKNLRTLSLTLILLCFFSSMLITNDVALITFVPFAILILKQTDNLKFSAFIIVMQTIGANLGSILTPLGNPQNLFLYSKMQITLFDFIKILFPYCALSFILILIFNLFIPKKQIEQNFENTNSQNSISKKNIKSIILFCALFILCLLTVLNIIQFYFVLLIVFLSVFIFNKKLLLDADYILLLTFVCFFIFTNNISNIEVIKNFLVNLIFQKEFFVSLLTSQIISNVPAALLLQPFSKNLTELLLGVNIGGLGTLIASLASLISFKIYSKEKDLNIKTFFITFTFLNLIFLAILILFHLFMRSL
jgi:Na+/H+ antiporter NhaD/arsenite permease-like protein